MDGHKDESFRFGRMHYLMVMLGMAMMLVIFTLAPLTPRKGQSKMAKEDAIVGLKMLDEVQRLFKNAVEQVATARTRKYKASNDSLRKEQAVLKQKVAGLEAEFKPMATRATSAEKTVGEQADRIKELKLNVDLLTKELAGMKGK